MTQAKTLQVEAIPNGTVIDHIPATVALLAVELLTKKEDRILIGVNLPSPSLGRKGILKIYERILDEEELHILAVLAPEATVNIIADCKIVEKVSLVTPESVESLFVCGNLNCITNHQPVMTVFHKTLTGYKCNYCERNFPVEKLQVWRSKATFSQD